MRNEAEQRLGPPDKLSRSLTGAVAAGAASHLLAAIAAGGREPWDAADQAPYLLLVFSAGFICGVSWPRRFWVWSVGLFLGQVLGVGVASVIFGSPGDLASLPIGAISAIPTGILALVGATAGAIVGAWARGGYIDDL